MNIYGASGHAKVIIDIAKSRGSSIDVIFDDDIKIEYLGGQIVAHEFSEEMKNSDTVIAIGNNTIRKKVADSFMGKISDAICHKSSIISPTAILGKGTVVMPNACINASTKVGEYCIINTASTVDHDCEIESFVHISPSVAIAGNVEIGHGTHIGIGAVVIPGIKIGKWVTVGAGAVIIRDIPDYAVVVGNPGNIIKYKETDYE